jgi:general secretion pathway protein E
MNNDGNGSSSDLATDPSQAATDQFAEMSPEATVHRLIDYAVQIGASDVFFNCNDHEVEISARHLGVVKQIALLPAEVGFRCMGFIRAAAGMRYHEKRQPQDGRWLRRKANGRTTDMRLNTMPTIYGESLAIRLLERNSQLRQLDALGFVGPQMDLLISMLLSPSGLILVTGPTGAGKTTTLYACLEYLNDGRRKIHSIEDPVEYTLPGVQQSQVDEVNGPDYPQLLRSVLRQGPDVIMIGELRDKIAAETAVRAANSGQLVFATLHAPVAAAAIQSLIGLGIPPYFVCTSLLGVLGQRLIRTLNPKTKISIDLTDAPRTFEEVQPWLAPDEGKRVCAASHDDGTEGFTDRTGVFEVLVPTPPLRKLIRERQPSSAVAQKAVEDGMLDFRRSALIKVAKGITSFDEMLRVVPTGDLWVDE